jgi:hypothetical protein
MWFNYGVSVPTLNNVYKKKWIGGNRDASQVAVQQRVNQIGIRFPNTNNNVSSFNNSKEINTVNDALTRVRAGGEIAPPKKSVNKFKGPTRGYPVGPLIRTTAKTTAVIHPKTGMVGKNVNIMVHTYFH